MYYFFKIQVSDFGTPMWCNEILFHGKHPAGMLCKRRIQECFIKGPAGRKGTVAPHDDQV